MNKFMGMQEIKVQLEIDELEIYTNFWH